MTVALSAQALFFHQRIGFQRCLLVCYRQAHERSYLESHVRLPTHIDVCSHVLSFLLTSRFICPSYSLCIYVSRSGGQWFQYFRRRWSQPLRRSFHMPPPATPFHAAKSGRLVKATCPLFSKNMIRKLFRFTTRTSVSVLYLSLSSGCNSRTQSDAHQLRHLPNRLSTLSFRCCPCSCWG